MSIDLLGFVYYDNGNPVTTATVEVYNQVPALVTSGSTNASGQWSFTALADGVTYDVKVIVGSIVRWIKGGEKHQIANMNLTTSLSIAGKLTVTTNGLEVTAGNVGIGAANASNVGLLVKPVITASSAEATALKIPSGTTLTAAANSDQLFGIRIVGATFSPSTFTSVAMYGLHVSPTFGVSTSNNGGEQVGVLVNPTYSANNAPKYGAKITSPTTAGSGDNYGVYITAPSGSSGNNYGLVNLGISYLQGAVIVGAPANPSVSGDIRLGNNRNITWRNAANSADIILGYDGVDDFNFQANTFGTVGALSTYARVKVNGTQYKIQLYAL